MYNQREETFNTQCKQLIIRLSSGHNNQLNLEKTVYELNLKKN